MGKRHIPGSLRRKDKKKSVGIAATTPAVCLVLLVLLVLLIGAVIGRYQRQLHSDISARAKEFYFTSDFLDGETHTLAPGSTEVTFTLSNHADELRYSEVDISYEVSVEPDTDSSGGGTTGTTDSGVTVKIDNNTGTLKNGGVHDEKITISDLQAGTYVITAVGTGGYSKTPTAKIEIPSEKEDLYFYMETIPGEYTILTVWNEGDVGGKVTITYSGIPDNTNPNMKDWVTSGETFPKEVEIGLEPHESKVFRFFSGTVKVNGAARKTPN